MALLTTSSIQLELDCYPKVNAQIQQPWDAADLYLIEHGILGERPAVINDQWGALTCFLSQQNRTIYSWTDSFCSQQAIRSNLARNTQSFSENINLDKDIPCLPKTCDSLWIQCPKSFDQLHWWLNLAIDQLGAGTIVSLSGMSKHIPVKWLNWLEQHNDEYQQHPIKKKARLMTFKLGSNLPPLQALKGYSGPDNKDVNALPGVFSRDHLDIGSRFFIQQISQLNQLSGKVIDLGCGNGLLSLACLHYFPTEDLELILCDDSSLALNSAARNLAERGYQKGTFYHTDALLNVSADVNTILCNPPFHSGNRISTAAAERMFSQASKLLHQNGQLLVIANHHLPYTPILKKGFKSVKQLNRDAKFVIYQCQGARS